MSVSSMLARFDDAKPIEDRNPFIGPGQHRLAVVEYKPFGSKKHGEAIGCTFLVISSDNPATPPGTLVFQGWYLNRAPYFVGDTKELDSAVDFISKLVDCQLAAARAQANELLGSDVAIAKQQARGMLIDCTGTTGTGKKVDPKTGQLATFTTRSWAHVPMAPEQITEIRTEIEVKPIVRAHLARQSRMTAAPPPAPPAGGGELKRLPDDWAPAGTPVPAGWYNPADRVAVAPPPPPAAPPAPPAGGILGNLGIK